VTYSLDSTENAESWIRSQQELHAILDDALQDPEIAEALANESLAAADARLAVLENPTVLAQIKSARDWSGALFAAPASELTFGRGPRLRNARPALRIGVALAMIVLYLVILPVAVRRMPWWAVLISVVGLLATIALGVLLAGEDAMSVARAVRNARNRAIWWQSVRDEIVLPELRQFIEEQRASNYSTTLNATGVYGLYQDDEDAPTIIVASGERLRRILERSTCDAVAIAGHRGVGKTTTISAVARGLFSDPGGPPPLAVVVSAPSRYEARDFVLHLHAVLCKEVISRLRRLLGEPSVTGDRAFVKPKRGWIRAIMAFVFGWIRSLAQVLCFAAVCLAIGFLFWGKSLPQYVTDLRELARGTVTDIGRLSDALSDVQPPGSVAWPFLLFAAFAVAGVVVVYPITTAVTQIPKAMRRGYLHGKHPPLVELLDSAYEQLRRIRFLQTYTSGWSGKIGIAPRHELGWTRSMQYAEQQLTHPEVVEKFREFAGRAAKVLTTAGVIERIVIAIDELDKIAQPEKAHELINDIKGIFRIEGCLFLVAVSDDAMATFERRGIAVRDALDSAFSEMVRMDSFTLAESRRWMGRRLLGVPEPFCYLCHCLSGGLPRELRRSTIDMIDAVRDTERRDLETIATIMVNTELDRKAHAFSVAARQFDDSAELTSHLTDLLMIPQVREPAELVALARQLAPGTDSALPRARWQSACFVLFGATIRELFTNELGEADLKNGIELLATARAQLAVDPKVAWRVVRGVRTRFGLTDPEDAALHAVRSG
jgi:hypothetical protein